MKEAKSLYKERIVTDPQIMVGKPVVKGTRIPVQRVIDHLAHNPDLDDLFAAYPELTVEDVKACLQFAGAMLSRRQPRPRAREVPRAAQPL
jgi:uncharacterized protein (DUF433 family)